MTGVQTCALPIWGASSKDVNKPHYGYETGYDLFAGAFGNVYANATTLPYSPVKQLTRTTTAVNIGGTDYYPVTFIDPRITDYRYFEPCCVPPFDGFYTPVVFQGAFYKYNWAVWTCAGRLDMMPGVSAWGTYDIHGAPQLAITEDGAGKITVSLDAGVCRGYPAEVWVAWYEAGAGWNYYDVDKGTWGTAYNKKAMPMMDFSREVLDATTMPAGAVVHFMVDYKPDGSPTAYPVQAGYEQHTTVL